MIKKEDVYKIGRIGKPHGVHGEVQMQYSDDVFDVVDANYLLLNVDGILVPFFMEEYRFRSDEIVLIKFCDINTEAQLAEEGTNELSWAQIVGYSLIDNTTKKDVGTIVAVDETTVNTLFEVNSPEGDELLIPASNELITAINSEEKTITINIPEGLLDL